MPVIMDRIEEGNVGIAVRQHRVVTHVDRTDRVRSLRMTARKNAALSRPFVNFLRIPFRKEEGAGRPEAAPGGGRLVADRIEERRIIERRFAMVKLAVRLVKAGSPIPFPLRAGGGQIVEEGHRNRRAERFGEPFVDLVVRQAHELPDRIGREVVDKAEWVGRTDEDHRQPFPFRNVPDERPSPNGAADIDPFFRFGVHRPRGLQNTGVDAVHHAVGKRDRNFGLEEFRAGHFPLVLIEAFGHRLRELLAQPSPRRTARKTDIVVEDDLHSRLVRLAEHIPERVEIFFGQIFRQGRVDRQEGVAAETVFFPLENHLADQLARKHIVGVPERNPAQRKRIAGKKVGRLSEQLGRVVRGRRFPRRRRRHTDETKRKRRGNRACKYAEIFHQDTSVRQIEKSPAGIGDSAAERGVSEIDPVRGLLAGNAEIDFALRLDVDVPRPEKVEF